MVRGGILGRVYLIPMRPGAIMLRRSQGAIRWFGESRRDVGVRVVPQGDHGTFGTMNNQSLNIPPPCRAFGCNPRRGRGGSVIGVN